MRWFFSSETSSQSMRTVLETQLLGNKQSACQPFLTSRHPPRLTEIIFHPEYDESGAGGLSYDVALIKLSGSADARFCFVYLNLYFYFCIFYLLFYHARFHWPACLPSQDADYTGDMGWMYGETLPIHFWAVPSTDPCQSLQQ